MEKAKIKVRVHAVRYEADGVLSFELQALDGSPLPPFTAGAHIDLSLPGDISRSYSLTNRQDDRDRYVIAVNRDEKSRGGSKYIHDAVRPGTILEVTAPTNTFALIEDAAHSVFLGGGIGITPLLCMIKRLDELNRDWRLYYACRTRQRAAFLRELTHLTNGTSDRLTTTFDQEPGFQMFDLPAIVKAQPAGTHFYCCGPVGMLKVFEEATSGLPTDTVHVEYFSSDTPKAEGGFEVVLARTKKTLWVRPEQTILATLLENGLNVAHSCQEGVCGTCETVVLEGTPDHRDKVLSAREKASNKKMMICCSGAIGGRLVLDL